MSQWDDWRVDYMIAQMEDENRLQNAIWRTRDGRETPIDKMSDNHLHNTIRMLERDPNLDTNPIASSYREIMADELKRRAQIC